MAVGLRAFDPYVDQLEAWACGRAELDSTAAPVHLDGEASRQLRRVVPLDDLRTIGAFFTGTELARQLLSLVPGDWDRFVDPACGCGDLLLAASARLPILPSLEETLLHWNERLGGRDRVPAFVRAARARLALSARARGAIPAGTDHPTDLLTNIRPGDGSTMRFDSRQAVLINPPFGRVHAPADCDWTSGLTTEAALFLYRILESCPDSTYFAAVLPEVLRAGSRYERFRRAVHSRLVVHGVQSAGVFDALTDVDVFLLAGEVAKAGSSPRPWTGTRAADRLEKICDVRVGTVVAYRDALRGPARLYLDARNRGGNQEVWPSDRRRFEGTVFEAPFVVIPRTNRPVQNGGRRVRATIVRARHPVAVENHLLVLLPHGRSLKECKRLIRVVESPATTNFLNQRLRCRHLTVRALREIPL